MVVKVKPEQLDEAIRGQLETYSADVEQKVNENMRDVAEKTAAKLRRGGTYKERTGKYTPDWSVTDRKNIGVIQTKSYSVHNRKNYQLTHLLEYGHVNRRGNRIVGKARAFEHIKPAEQAAQDMAVEAVEKAVRSANGGI